jgi:hypothetical protein
VQHGILAIAKRRLVQVGARTTDSCGFTIYDFLISPGFGRETSFLAQLEVSIDHR